MSRWIMYSVGSLDSDSPDDFLSGVPSRVFPNSHVAESDVVWTIWVCFLVSLCLCCARVFSWVEWMVLGGDSSDESI